MSAALSGMENDRFFGTISPSTTCKNETMISAMVNATPAITPSGHPVRLSGPSRAL